MTEQTKTRFPAPLYAAAGAGDLAYQQLRKLPAVVNELSERAAASLRTANEQANTKASQLRDKAADHRLRRPARQRRQRGDHVRPDRAGARRRRSTPPWSPAASAWSAPASSSAADVVNADLETTEEPKAVEAAKDADAAEAAQARQAGRKYPAGRVDQHMIRGPRRSPGPAA